MSGTHLQRGKFFLDQPQKASADVGEHLRQRGSYAGAERHRLQAAARGLEQRPHLLRCGIGMGIQGANRFQGWGMGEPQKRTAVGLELPGLRMSQYPLLQADFQDFEASCSNHAACIWFVI